LQTVSHEILNLFETLVVRQPSPFSDHCQLITWLKIDSSLLTNDQESLRNEQQEQQEQLYCTLN